MSELTIVANGPTIEILRIDHDGRIYWRQHEVETDGDLRAAMMDLAANMKVTVERDEYMADAKKWREHTKRLDEFNRESI